MPTSTVEFVVVELVGDAQSTPVSMLRRVSKSPELSREFFATLCPFSNASGLFPDRVVYLFQKALDGVQVRFRVDFESDLVSCHGRRWIPGVVCPTTAPALSLSV